jgi:hypothetical protein
MNNYFNYIRSLILAVHSFARPKERNQEKGALRDFRAGSVLNVQGNDLNSPAPYGTGSDPLHRMVQGQTQIISLSFPSRSSPEISKGIKKTSDY